MRVLNALVHVELSNAASVRPGPAALALNSTGVGRGQRKVRGRDRHRVKSLQAHSSHSSLACKTHETMGFTCFQLLWLQSDTSV